MLLMVKCWTGGPVWALLFVPIFQVKTNEWMEAFFWPIAFSHRCVKHRREWNSEEGGDLRSGWGKRTSGCIHLRRTTKEATRGQTNWTMEMFFNLEFLNCLFFVFSNLEFLKMLEFGAGQAADWFRPRERGKNSILRSCNWDTADWQAHVYQEGNHGLSQVF